MIGTNHQPGNRSHRARGGRIFRVCLLVMIFAASNTVLQAAQLDDVLEVTKKCLGVGVTVGSLPFAVVFLWSLFQRILGEPTTRD